MKTAPKPPSISNNVRIGMLSLGCPKTLVDSETILGKLQGYQLVNSVVDCDVALLNTCAFIEDAQHESVDRILELIELKKEKKIKAVVVMGCLVQRYPKELQKELQEVDAFIGSGDYHKIPEIVDKITQGDKVFSVHSPGYLATAAESRVALTPHHYRYIKISEGCDHICTFCTIPSFRGKHRSRSIEDVVKEASVLIAQGAKEIILTGQDTSYFGRDLSGQFLLPELLNQLDQLPHEFWIRLLYVYPSCVTNELIQSIAKLNHVCKYLDMPLQHASDPMLLAMKRGITKRKTYDLIRKFRDEVNGLAIRTTFIVGFPGETDKDFEELLDFMRDICFDRLGIFSYSQEAGTPSAKMPGQIPDKIKRERLDRAMTLQQEISLKNNSSLMGKTLDILIDEPDEENSKGWKGRSYMDAPEVDGTVLVHSEKELKTGKFYPVKITEFKEYDLVGHVE